MTVWVDDPDKSTSLILSLFSTIFGIGYSFAINDMIVSPSFIWAKYLPLFEADYFSLIK